MDIGKHNAQFGYGLLFYQYVDEGLRRNRCKTNIIEELRLIFFYLETVNYLLFCRIMWMVIFLDLLKFLRKCQVNYF